MRGIVCVAWHHQHDEGGGVDGRDVGVFRLLKYGSKAQLEALAKLSGME